MKFVIVGYGRVGTRTARILQSEGHDVVIVERDHEKVGRAEEAGVPVLLVQTDTTTAIERIEDVVRAGRSRNESTVRRMGELLRTYGDVDAMLGLSE